MVDLPQHLAQVAVLKELLLNSDGHRFPYAELFSIDWFTPYLTGYGLVALLSLLVPLLTAAKLVVGLAIAGIPLASAWLLHERGSDPRWVWLTVPGAYGFAFCWGFLNFLVAVPLGLMFLAAVSHYARQPGWRGALAIVMMVHALFFSHLLVLALCGLIATLFVIERADGWRSAVRRLLPLASILPVVGFWIFRALRSKTEQVRWPTRWDLSWHRALEVPDLILSVQPSLSHRVFGWALLLLPLLAGARLDRRLSYWLPALMVFLILLLVPNLLGGNFFTYHRFAVFLLPLWLLALRWPEPLEQGRQRLVMAAAIAMALVWVGLTALRLAAHDRESADFEPVLAQMEPGKRVIGLAFDPNSRFNLAPTYLHYVTWYQAERGGVADYSFASNYAQPLHYRPEKQPAAGLSFEWRPWSFDWEASRRDAYDYLLARLPADSKQAPLAIDDCRAHLLLHSGSWWLYHLNMSGAGCPAVRSFGR